MTSLDQKVVARGDAVGFFDESADDYAGKHYAAGVRSFMTVRQRRVLEFVDALRLPAGADALDAGCGPGYLVEALATRGLRVKAMDAADGMLRQARARMESSSPPYPVEFREGNIEQLPYDDGSFDLVCSTGVIEYLETDAKVLGEFHRILRSGGHLVLPVTNVWSPANWLDGIVEPLKRQRWARAPFNSVWGLLGHPPVLPRHFHVRKHRPDVFRAALADSGFTLHDEIYFHFLPVPRPFNRLAAGLCDAIGERMEENARSWIAPAGEGFLTVSRRD